MSKLDQTLELWNKREPRDADSTAAQGALEQALAAHDTRVRRRRARRIGGFAVATGVALGAVWMSLTLAPVTAFARVQESLRSFNTMAFDLDLSRQDLVMMRAHVLMTRAGDYRYDMGDILKVRNVAANRTLVLVRPASIYLEHEVTERNEVDNWIELIEGLQHLDSGARLLPESRVIGGLTASGWQIRIENRPGTVWATASGLPLELDLEMPGGTHMLYRFHFDPEIAPGSFDTSIPAGYRLADKETEECQRTGKPIWTAVSSETVDDPVTGKPVVRKWRTRLDCKPVATNKLGVSTSSRTYATPTRP